jgi:hypothetical protein
MSDTRRLSLRTLLYALAFMFTCIAFAHVNVANYSVIFSIQAQAIAIAFVYLSTLCLLAAQRLCVPPMRPTRLGLWIAVNTYLVVTSLLILSSQVNWLELKW